VAVLVAAATSLVVISNRHRPDRPEVDPSRPATEVEIRQLFDLATASRPERCRFEADIEVTTPPYTVEQVKKELAGIEDFMQRDNARLTPRQKADWRIAQSNAIVKAHSGRRLMHVREWFSGNYYRLDKNDEGMGIEQFMKAHPDEYYETWVKIPGSPFSPYASYRINRNLRDMMMSKQVEPIGQFDLWQALGMHQEAAGLFAGALSLRDADAQKRKAFDYRGLKIDPAKVQELHAQTNQAWRLKAVDEILDGTPVTHFTLRFEFTLLPGIKLPRGADYKPNMFQGEVWVGQVAGKAVCLQGLLTNLTDHTSSLARLEKYGADGSPVIWTTTKIKADASSEKQRATFKRVETDPAFTDEEAFAPVFPPDYIVSDVSSGKGVILQNPHPEIPIAR